MVVNFVVAGLAIIGASPGRTGRVWLVLYMKSTGPKLWLPLTPALNVELFIEYAELVMVKFAVALTVVAVSVYHLSAPAVSWLRR